MTSPGLPATSCTAYYPVRRAAAPAAVLERTDDVHAMHPGVWWRLQMYTPGTPLPMRITIIGPDRSIRNESAAATTAAAPPARSAICPLPFQTAAHVRAPGPGECPQRWAGRRCAPRRTLQLAAACRLARPLCAPRGTTPILHPAPCNKGAPRGDAGLAGLCHAGDTRVTASKQLVRQLK